MFNPFLVLELVIDGFNDAPSSKHDFIHEWHQLIFHVFLDAGDQLRALLPQSSKQIFGNVAPVAKQLAKHSLSKFRYGLDVLISS